MTMFLQSRRLRVSRRVLPRYVGLCPQLCRSSGSERFPLFAAHIHHLPSVSDEPMPPDYELQSYWNARFENEHHFEWLGDGSDTILPHIRSHLSRSRISSHSSLRPCRLLHIGAGTSSLAERIRELYHDVYGDEANEQAIVNTDFAENLVARMQEHEASLAQGRPGKGMRWVCVDAMKWDDMRAALGSSGEDPKDTFDLVVDKSTSDAISCREDVVYKSDDPGCHPAFNDYLATHERQAISLAPVEVLAVHLASLVKPGGLWVALTFSSNRFAFLSLPEAAELVLPRASRYWTVEDIQTIDAPTGMEGRGYAPIVQHYVFLLRRKEYS